MVVIVAASDEIATPVFHPEIRRRRAAWRDTRRYAHVVAMTILSDQQIFDRLGDTVIIDPFNAANVNTSSVDVTLGEWYFEEQLNESLNPDNRLYNIWDFADVQRVWGEPKRARHPNYDIVGVPKTELLILLPPKHTILAHTAEFIGGRRNLTTMMKARSSFGRNFIEVCKCAGYGDVGYTNRWTMEITNNSQHYYIPLVVGRRIAQIVFMETGELRADDYTAAGKYQSAISLDDLKAAWNPYMMLPRLDRDRDIIHGL